MIDILVVFDLHDGKYAEAHAALRELGLRNSDPGGVPLPGNTVRGSWEPDNDVKQICTAISGFLTGKEVRVRRILVTSFLTAAWIGPNPQNG